MFKKLLNGRTKAGSLKERIYLDYASLTPIDPEVVKEMNAFSTAEYLNPSSLYKEGVAAKKALESARKVCADSIKAHADEIIFTSGGTEANNLAIIGAVESLRSQEVDYKDMHVITSMIEHSSVRECVNYLNDREVQVDVIGVDEKGLVNVDELKKKIKPNTVIVSIMMVNNEIGTVEPIRDIAKIIRQVRAQFKETSAFNFQSDISYPIFHTDAAQAPLYQEINTEKLGADLITIDGSKVCGPRGIGLLYKKRTIQLEPVLHGGGQESGMRSGTEPLPLIVGLAKALQIAGVLRADESLRVAGLRKQFIDGLMNLAKGIRVNGPRDVVVGNVHETNDRAHSAPHILNIFIPKIDAEFFILQLDAKGIACSTKSSCLRDEDESYVLKAIGVPSQNAIRFSFGRWTTAKEIDRTLLTIQDLLS